MLSQGDLFRALSNLELLSIFVCGLLVFGYLNRRTPRIHIPSMAIAFLIDMTIVVYIEVTRDAVASAKKRMGALMIVHILLSLTVLVLYFGQIITGLRKVKGRPSRWHGQAALWFLAARFGNLITSFMVMH